MESKLFKATGDKRAIFLSKYQNQTEVDTTSIKIDTRMQWRNIFKVLKLSDFEPEIFKQPN